MSCTSPAPLSADFQQTRELFYYLSLGMSVINVVSFVAVVSV